MDCNTLSGIIILCLFFVAMVIYVKISTEMSWWLAIGLTLSAYLTTAIITLSVILLPKLLCAWNICKCA